MCPVRVIYIASPDGRMGSAMRIRVEQVEQQMAVAEGKTLEEVLEVFEVFSSGSLTDEVYVLDDVGGKRIAIAPSALRQRFKPPAPA